MFVFVFVEKKRKENKQFFIYRIYFADGHAFERLARTARCLSCVDHRIQSAS